MKTNRKHALVTNAPLYDGDNMPSMAKTKNKRELMKQKILLVSLTN